jgi:hypothetical protein
VEVGAKAEAELRTQGRPRTCHLRLRAKRVSSSLSPSLSWQLEAGSRIGRASLHGGRGSSPVSPLPLSSLSSPAMIGRVMRLWARPGGTTSSSLSSPFGAGEVTETGPQVRTGCGAGATHRIWTEWLLRAHVWLALGVREHPQVSNRPWLADGLLMVDAEQPSSVPNR